MFYSHPDWTSPFELQILSRASTSAEFHWHMLQQELFAVEWGLEQFRPYILGHHVKVISDHAKVKWLTYLVPHKAKLAWWCMSMKEFDFHIGHRLGITNTVPDTLSRQSMSDFPLLEEPYAPADAVNSDISGENAYKTKEH